MCQLATEDLTWTALEFLPLLPMPSPLLRLWVQVARLHQLLLSFQGWDLGSTVVFGSFCGGKLEVSTIYSAYVREYPHKIWPEIWYSTSILGSWNSH